LATRLVVPKNGAGYVDLCLGIFLNFIYFTTITKRVIQLILIMLVGTDVCVGMVFVRYL